MMENTPIQQFYDSSNVFVTGGTGFMGKILIEKMLRTTNISKLYMLVREKKGKNASQVLDNLFEDKIFSKLKEVCPSFRDKVHPIPGDCSVSQLGISYDDNRKLVEDTNIVFHLAATLRFDTNLKEAYSINVNGTKEVMFMAKHMRNLKVLIFVSTAYSNFPRKFIDEQIYDFPYSCEGLTTVIDELDNQDIEKLTPRLLGNWPNTYTFTKAMAESFIQKTGRELPVAIFRPSVVMPTYEEPTGGWTDNLNGPVGMCLGVISGILNVMPYDVEDNLADLVPVDSCIAGLMAVAWDVSTKPTRNQENVAVYNFVSDKENTLSWKRMMNMIAAQAKKQKTSGSTRRVIVMYPPNAVIFWISMISFHLVPAIIHDLYASFSRKKLRMFRIYKRYIKGYNLIYPFFTRTWTFGNKNVKEIWNKMDQRDRQLFPLALDAVDYEVYFERFVEGLRNNFLSKIKNFEKPITDVNEKSPSLLSQVLMSILVFVLFTSIIDMKIL